MESIGFDLDDVLYNFADPAYRELQVYHRLSATYTEFWGNHLKYYTEEFWKNFIKIETLYSCEKITPQDLVVLNYLAEKYNIYYITNRPPEILIATQNWLKRESLPYPENLILTDKKEVEISRLNIIAFTEDQIKNIKKIPDTIKIFLKDKPWNQNWEKENVIRIYSLMEILKCL